MQPQSEKNRKTDRKPKSRKARRRQKEQQMKFLRQNSWLILLAVLVLVALILFICVITGGQEEAQQEPAETQKTSRYEKAYLCADSPSVSYLDENLEPAGTAVRGSKVTYAPESTRKKDGVTYYLTYLDSLKYGYVAETNLTDNPDDVVREERIFVRTPQNLRLDPESVELGGLLEKGTELKIIGYDYMTDGIVHLYQVTAGEETGYISGEYTASTQEAAMEVYDRFGVYMIHAGRADRFGGGDGESLDYYPRQKASFENNVMPEHVYALYLTCDPDVLGNIDAYIAYAKTTKINAFVVNIMDGTSIGYDSEVFRKYSPTADSYANNTQEEYKTCIQKIKDAGFYVIGRLTTFNDSFFVSDHPEYAISDAAGDPLYIAGSYWPSAFCRYVWEYKVELAKEAVALFGFNEIQFDYVRFPDGTYYYEEDGNIDYRNEYDETKAQAIQRFLMYACDELHDCGVYVSADVFGETSGSYVTAYGQYWPAISNVVDVISGMPYPDHFSQNGSYRPWEHPYETMLDWAKNAAKRQTETPSPAIVRTWIQAYDAIRPPYNTYGAEEVGGQLRALQENGLDGGFMAWNAMCSIPKLETLKPAFDALPD